MRPILVIAGLGYLCIVVVIGIHGVITGDAGPLEVIDHAARWPLTIFN